MNCKIMWSATGIALAGALTLSISAQAADLAGYHGNSSLKDAPVFEEPAIWTGFYLGVNGGGALGGQPHEVKLNFNGAPYGNSNRMNLNDGFGGGQAGYNWQHGALVLGAETDIQGGGISKSATSVVTQVPGGSFPTPGDVITHKLDMDYFGTLRGRIGYAVDGVLVYATAGLAYGGASFSEDKQNHVAHDAYATGTHNEVLAGYTAGAGYEYKFNNSWSFKAEYQYIDLGSISVSAPRLTYANEPTNTVANSETDVNFHTGRIGINYKISDYEPLK